MSQEVKINRIEANFKDEAPVPVKRIGRRLEIYGYIAVCGSEAVSYVISA